MRPKFAICRVFFFLDWSALTWYQYYFTYCEAGFVTKTLGDAIITVGREGALELMEDIPV